MLTIAKQLENIKKELQVDFTCIDDNVFREIKDNIYNNFKIKIEDTSNFIWEQFIDNSAIYGEFAWKYIEELLKNSMCYLFFNQIECKNAYFFNNSRDLCTVIGETYSCEVYVTDYNGSYIICYNHEMFLTGCGEARKWLMDLKEMINPHNN